MKIVIQTQHRENYAAHDEGYIHGISRPHWKCKGGSTYFVGCDVDEAQSREFWARIEDAIQEKNEFFEEFIICTELFDDCDFIASEHCEEWETPWWVSELDGAIHFNRTVVNGEFGWMRKEIAKTHEAYIIRDGVREDIESSYQMINHQIVLYSELEQWFNTYAPKEAA